MFRTKQFMSITNIVLASLIVLALLIGLGMMVVFQPDEAEANHSSWWCSLTSHRSFSLTTGVGYITLAPTTANTNCSVCSWSSQTYSHTVNRAEQHTYTRDLWEHFVLLPFRWVTCHTHTGPWTSTGLIINVVVLCNRQPG